MRVPGGCADLPQPEQAYAPEPRAAHTFWVGNLRLVLDAQVSAGKQHTSVHECDRPWEHTVLVTDVAYPIEAIAQLYRGRADAENGFGELKNQWAMSGFTTHDIKRCQSTARACALVYNWWTWYCCAAHPTARMEAITSRPLLLAAVGKAANHAGQTTL